MRIRTLAVAFIAALVIALPSFVAAQGSPFAGTWKLNLAKSKYGAGAAPKSSTITTKVNADGSFTQTWDTVPATGGPVKYELTFKPDGKDYTYKGGNPTADSAAYKSVDPRSWDVTAKKGGKVVISTRTVLSADGKTRTATQTVTDAQGKTATNTLVYDKQ